jgi:signal transduction histidine kinase
VTSRARTRVVVVMLVVSATSSVFFLAYSLRLSSVVSAGLTAHGELEAELRRSLADEKQLARLDPRSAADYHRRFDATATLLRRLRVVEINRETLTRHVEELIVAAVALLLGSTLALVWERSSRIAEADRQRLRYLEHLSAWQEAARRHAHEIRTPLTAIRMEVDRLNAAHDPAESEAARASILREIRQLTEFTQNFTSFAAIPLPRKQRLDLSVLVGEFVGTFAKAWPNLRLRFDDAGGEAFVDADAEMIRRVLVNLAANSSQAANGSAGTLTFDVRHEQKHLCVYVSDDGPGLPPAIRPRLFEPYTTSRGIGEGMGLGLAISKKILLDHGGDLNLIASTSAGTTFRLSLPEAS